MQLLTSTILFVNDHKVPYNLFFNPGTGRYLFQPNCLVTEWHYSPSFWVYKKNSEWHLRGTESEEFKKQAIDCIMQIECLSEV